MRGSRTNGASDGGALLLSAGQGDAAFADDGVVFLGEALDVGVETCDFSGCANLLKVVFGKSKRDVAADGFGEQIGILRDVADRATQGFERPFANGAPVDEELRRRELPRGVRRARPASFCRCR